MSIFESNTSYKPFKYPWAVEVEKKHRVDMVWTENQIDLQDDLRQYNSSDGLATANVSHEVNKNMVDKLSMLFTEMDVNVGEGYAQLIPHVKNNEIRTLWMTFMSREVTHQRAYALAAETFGFTDSNWSDFKDYKEMQDKLDIISQDIGDLSVPLNFCKKLAVVFNGEGIALFGTFSSFLNLRRFGKMQGFNSVNEWSLKDEQEHVMSNIRIFKEARSNLSEEDQKELNDFVSKVINQYEVAEHKFLELLFEMGDQEDLTLSDSKDFISYLARLRKYQVGLIPSSEVGENPLEWIDYILSGSTHTNFFENKVVDYSHNGLSGEADYTKYLNYLEELSLK